MCRIWPPRHNNPEYDHQMTTQATATMPDFNAQIVELQDLINHFTTPVPARAGTALDWLNNVRGGWGKPITHPRLALFAGVHGTSNESDRAALNSIMNNINRADGRLGQLCKLANTDLRAYELDLSTPTGDTRTGAPALTPRELLMSTSYGMMAIEPDLDLVMATALGAGMRQACDTLVNDTSNNAIDALLKSGGFEICALMGATLAAHLAKKPILLEGMAGLAVLTLLYRANPPSIAHAALLIDADHAGLATAALPVSVFTRTLATDAPGAALAAEAASLRHNELLLRPGMPA